MCGFFVDIYVIFRLQPLKSVSYKPDKEKDETQLQTTFEFGE